MRAGSVAQLFTALLRDEMTCISAVGRLFMRTSERETEKMPNHSQMPQIHCTTRQSVHCLCVLTVLHGSRGLS